MSMLRGCATVSLLCFAAIWGTLARLGLIALNTYDGKSIDPTIWAQGVGCLVMGWATHSKNKAYIDRIYTPASTMITTGFCGSVTTYASWVFGVFQAFSNETHYNRHGLHNVMDALSQTGATMGISLAALWAGRALGDFLLLERLPTPPSLHGATTDCISILIGTAFWAGSAILCGLYSPFRKVTFALVLAPPGAVIRWYLARLNSRPHDTKFLGIKSWPWGTLLANISAILVLCAAFTAQYVGRETGPFSRGAWTTNGCAALYGLQNGFTGCLSTISTFVVELTTLRPLRIACTYAITSWTLGVVISILLVGAPWWSIGMQGGCT